MKNILFFTPHLGYNGAEIMFSYLIPHLTKIKPILLSGGRGELISEIPSNIPVYIHPDDYVWKNRANRILKKFHLPDISEKQFKKIIKKYNIDYVFINTIAAQSIIPLLKKFKIPFILFTHDLPPMYEIISDKDFDFLFNNAIGIIGCSKLVCNNLQSIGLYNVKTFYEAIDIAKIKPSIEIQNKIRPKNFSKIFVMSGYRYFRKGFYLLPIIAPFLKQHNAAIVWLGSSNYSGDNEYIEKIIISQSLDNIILPGLLKGDEYYSCLNACDAFLLTSMIDPYPLVMLEAAYLQKPIIAFDSGGVSEFVKDGMGKVVPYYCVNAYLDAIRDFIDGKIPVDKELLRKEAEKHDITKRVSEFEDILLSFIK